MRRRLLPALVASTITLASHRWHPALGDLHDPYLHPNGFRPPDYLTSTLH